MSFQTLKPQARSFVIARHVGRTAFAWDEKAARWTVDPMQWTRYGWSEDAEQELRRLEHKHPAYLGDALIVPTPSSPNR